MTTQVLHLRSAVSQLRPQPTDLLDGQLMLNTNANEAGVYFRLSDNSLAKLGGVHVGTTPPNASAAGHAGNSEGEAWVDTTNSAAPLFKVYRNNSWFTVSTAGLDGDKGQKGEVGLQGIKGETGAKGNKGTTGDKGGTGEKGVDGGAGGEGVAGTAATIAVGTTTTLGEGINATVSNSGSSSAATFDFGIPQGQKGEPGSNGTDGSDGTDGADGSDATVNLTNVLTALSLGSYADDAAAHTAGLANGDVYWNTTDVKLRAA